MSKFNSVNELSSFDFHDAAIESIVFADSKLTWVVTAANALPANTQNNHDVAMCIDNAVISFDDVSIESIVFGAYTIHKDGNIVEFNDAVTIAESEHQNIFNETVNGSGNHIHGLENFSSIENNQYRACFCIDSYSAGMYYLTVKFSIVVVEWSNYSGKAWYETDEWKKHVAIVSPFDLRLLEWNWINGMKDNLDDLCLHGKIYLRLGEKVVADSYECTVSVAGLYLLRSITRNHDDKCEHMFPCCGHSMFPSNDLQNVTICGCPNGLQLFVKHDDDKVHLTVESESEAEISLVAYKHWILQFVEAIEKIYVDNPRQLPSDDYDRKGYESFWNEWRDLKSTQF